MGTQPYTIPYEDGSVYKGECLNALPHGQGRLTLSNGNYFEGVFHEGNPLNGIMHYSNRDKYTGEISNLNHHGRGELQQGGNLYKGIFEDGVLVEAEIMRINGDIYVGPLKDGMKEGRGVLRFSNGD